MVWKCPRCPFKSTKHTTMMKHFYAKHHVSKAKTKAKNKGKDKKVYTFKPLKRK